MITITQLTTIKPMSFHSTKLENGNKVMHTAPHTVKKTLQKKKK